MSTEWLEQVKWNSDGLVPAIAQDINSKAVLMMAWMNRDALQATLDEGRAIYWSRSRGKLWRKGEESGHVQQLHEVRLDCDNDTILLLVQQVGGIACHTGREHCFFQQWQEGKWQTVEPVLKSSDEIYGKK